MSRTPNTNGLVVPVKAQPNVYTALLLVAIITLGVTLAICLKTLLVGYGLSFGDLFGPLKGA